MRRSTALLLTTVFLTAGCTSSSSESSDGSDADSSGSSGDSNSAAEPVGPPCDDVWVIGATVPEDYSTCLIGSEADGVEEGSQDVTECDDGSRLIVFDDSVWAFTGGEVIEPDVAPVQDTEAYGAAYAECTDE